MNTPWPEAVRELGDRIANLTVREAAQLAAYLRSIVAIDPSECKPIVMVDSKPTPPVGERLVRLDRYDPARKIQLIKLLREMFQLGLYEAKEWVESGPRVVAGPLAVAEAQRMKQRLEAAGATVTLSA